MIDTFASGLSDQTVIILLFCFPHYRNYPSLFPAAPPPSFLLPQNERDKETMLRPLLASLLPPTPIVPDVDLPLLGQGLRPREKERASGLGWEYRGGEFLAVSKGTTVAGKEVSGRKGWTKAQGTELNGGNLRSHSCAQY